MHLDILEYLPPLFGDVEGIAVHPGQRYSASILEYGQIEPA